MRLTVLSPSLAIRPEQLTKTAFGPFGHLIESPFLHDVRSMPTSISQLAPRFTLANQGTALKASPVAPWVDIYGQSSEGSQSKPTMSMFACFPRQVTEDSEYELPFLRVEILERHPYTTQTFIPLGVDPSDICTKYLVIVAPSLAPTEGFPNQGPPDLGNLRVFIASGRQAVTYGTGTWHAPMVVLGEKRIDFIVVQSTNGVPEDDCQEVDIQGGKLIIALDWLSKSTTRKANL